MQIMQYVSRYVVPFYFTYQDNGYRKLVSYFEEYKGQWEKKGFWQEYTNEELERKKKREEFARPDSYRNADKAPVLDLYTSLLRILDVGDGHKSGGSLGTAFSYIGGALFENLFFCDIQRQEDGTVVKEKFPLSCTNLGVIFFQNGIGFLWYEIALDGSALKTEYYLKFQKRFKELGLRSCVEDGAGREFYMGQWIEGILPHVAFDIRFWAERRIAPRGMETITVPDNALLFQYLYVPEAQDEDRRRLAFRAANGYDEHFNPPDRLGEESFEPFGNVSVYTSKSGMAYVVSAEATNDYFFQVFFPGKFKRDYFFLYLLLLYQSYSCSHYARLLLTELPADAAIFESSAAHLKRLDALDTQIDLFLVKSVFESVSNIQHQNGVYRYGKRRLCINEDIQSLTVGLGALREIESEKEHRQEAVFAEQLHAEEEGREKKLNGVLVLFGCLVVFSAGIDALSLIDWWQEHFAEATVWHWLSMVVIVGLVVLVIAVFGGNIREEHRGRKRRESVEKK